MGSQQKNSLRISRINKFVLTVSLLTFIMISVVAYGIYTRMVKERVYGLRQPVTGTAFVVANIIEYRRSVAIDLTNTLNPTEEQLLVGLRTTYADSVPPSYLYSAGSCLTSSDECIQVKEFKKNYCAGIMQVVKYRHVKDTGFISFDGETFVYYLYPVTHNRSPIFLLDLERFFLLSKSLATDSENLVFSSFKDGKSMTGDEHSAKNAVFTISEAMERFSYLPTGLHVFAYKEDVHFQVCTLIIFLAALVAATSGASCLYLIHGVINRGIVEEETVTNNHFERILGDGLFFSAADVKKLYSVYNSAFLDNLTRAMDRRSFDEDLKALPEKGGYLHLFGVDKLRNINDIFGRLLGDEVLMKVVKILKSQIPVDKGKAYRFGGDEFAVIYIGGMLEGLLSILKEIAHFQVGNINLSTSIDVAHSNECITARRLKILADERLYKSRRNGGTQISWQQSLLTGRTNDFTQPELVKPGYLTNRTHRRTRLSLTRYHPA